MNHPIHNRQDIAAELDSPGFQEMFPRLAGYVIGRLRFAWRREPEREEVNEVVQDAIAAALGGRSWRMEDSFWEFLCGVVWNVICNRARAERRYRRMTASAPLDEVPEPPAPSLRGEDGIDARERAVALYDEVADDAELVALVRAFLQGNDTGPALALALRCDKAHVEALFKRLRRRADAVGLRPGEDDEEERSPTRAARGAAPARRRARRAPARRE